MANFVNQTFRFGHASISGKSTLDKRWPAKKSQHVISLSIMLMLAQTSASFAEPLVTTIPAQSFNIPPGDLTKALTQYSANAGVLLSFDSDLTHNKTTPGLKGQYTVKEGFSNLLKGTGLEVINNQKGELELRKAPLIKVSEADNLPLNKELDTVQVRAKRFYEIGPLPGLGLTKDQIPGNVQSITAKEIKESHSLSISDLLNKKLQSVNVNDYAGNPFQMDVTYRGFTAGPQIGTPQGLSVFFDGIRVNEPFGDVVNWDMIPMNALASVDVFPGSNPVFGLNTLGGAFTVKTKDGFNNEGVDAEILTGSFGRKQLQAEAGWNNGTVALFGAGNFFMEDGWRENSPSKVNQFFGKASYRGEKLDLHLSSLLVKTDLVGNGLVPSQLYEQDRNATFTSEDTTKNKLIQFQLSGAFQVNDGFSVTGQVYRRNSKRRALGADAYTDGYGQNNFTRRNLATGEVGACQFLSTNRYRIPDYYVLDIDPATGSNAFIDDFNLNSGNPGYDLNAALAAYSSGTNPIVRKNGDLDPTYANAAQQSFNYYKNPFDQALFESANIPVPQQLGDPTSYSNGDFSYQVPGAAYDTIRAYTLDIDPNVEGSFNYFYTPDGIKHIVTSLAPINKSTCQGQQLDLTDSANVDSIGAPVRPDGSGTNQPGVVEGTPTSLLTDNNIKQLVDGGSLQLNWNLENHKFMVGASIDSANASYTNSQRLGLLDNSRKAYLSPENIRDQYTAADTPISNNDFKGTSTTKSIYASETWSPFDTLHITGAARYNDTKIKNTVATRTAFTFFNLADYQSRPDYFNLCLGSVANCPGTGYRVSDGSKTLKPAETEKFSYYSLNPSLGATWQAKENLNIYSNFAQGTRTPSVIELGCAFDGRPSGQKIQGPDTNGNGLPDPEEMIDVPRSIAENRSCTLPTTLSGDPFLPQIKATTYDIGLRGTFDSVLGAENIQWNLGVYRTNLKDDIYLISVGAASSYFDTIGKTRRQGIEAGLSGRLNKFSFGLNYALTDATFQSSFDMISENNSSAVVNLANGLAGINGESFRSITVKPGDRMPGVPLHNLNANVNYDVTSKWQIGLSAVLHSGSFVRGNENNKHKQGAVETYNIDIPDGLGGFQNVQVSRQPSNNPGSVAGYTVFNFQTSYRFNSEWTASLLVNNLFDKEYFSAGRLGRNPFSPSINGAIGPGGYNYNSDDWLASNFLAPGAPRGAWININWKFDQKK